MSNMLKTALVAASPPILMRAARATRDKLKQAFARRTDDDQEPWFDADGIRLFTEHLASARTFVEYGCGRSTLFALNRSRARVVSVETSSDWAKRVLGSAQTHAERLDLAVVDLGEVGAFGMPMDFSHRRNFGLYVDSPWTRTASADLVLIDGRFRVACFCRSLLALSPGATLLFDDYLTRPHYHVVEELIRPDAMHGRMARFTNSNTSKLDLDAVRKMMVDFMNVRE